MTSTSKSIVVGYDGSPDAALALQWTLHTAELTHQHVNVVVAGPRHEGSAGGLTDDFEAQLAAGAASDAWFLLKAADGVQGEVTQPAGAPLPVLLEAAEDAGLLVVGSRGHNAFESSWLGSVSQHLAGHAACPVAVVRPAHNPRARRILVGVDGSPSSERALAYAAERADLTGERVLAVYAYQFPTFAGTGLAVQPIDIDTEPVEEAGRLAAELVAGVAVDHPDVHPESTAVIGRAGRVLANLSDDASLVVVGSRGRNPWKQLLLGSVSLQVLHRASCPVVVVR